MYTVTDDIDDDMFIMMRIKWYNRLYSREEQERERERERECSHMSCQLPESSDSEIKQTSH